MAKYSYEFKYYTFEDKGKMIIKKLYLNPLMDMYNGEISSYYISKSHLLAV